jgi:hypothetical protein
LHGKLRKKEKKKMTTHKTKQYELQEGRDYYVIHLSKHPDGGEIWFNASQDLSREYCESVNGKYIVCESRRIDGTYDNRLHPLGENGSFKQAALYSHKVELLRISLGTFGRKPRYKVENSPWLPAKRNENGIIISICENCGSGVRNGKCEKFGIPDNAFRCENCGTYIWGDNAQVFHICRKCLANELGKQYSYHNFPRRGDLQFTNPEKRNTALHMGWELEMHNINNVDIQKVARAFSKVLNPNPYKRYAHFERDGSLINGGIETISEPCTIKAHARQRTSIEQIYTIAQNYGFTTETTDNQTCGFHIHFDREFFGGYDKSRYAGLRLAYLVEVMFDRELSVINGRNGNTGYCQKYGILPEDDPLIANSKMHCGHGVSVNISNSATIELRIWGNPKTPEIMFAYLDISSALAKLARVITYDKLPKARFEYLGKYLTFAETPMTLQELGLDKETVLKLAGQGGV